MLQKEGIPPSSTVYYKPFRSSYRKDRKEPSNFYCMLTIWSINSNQNTSILLICVGIQGTHAARALDSGIKKNKNSMQWLYLYKLASD